MAVEQIPALLAAGVACLKIEGRLKGPEYVALTTRVYRDAVDAAWAALPAAPAARSAPAQPGGRRDDAGGAAPLEEGGRAAAAGPPGAQQLADLQQVGRVSGV
jgi:collagenase-like PrtC family protease